MRQLTLRSLLWIITLALWSCLALPARSEALTLSSAGKTSYSIVVRTDASAAELKAAAELSEHLKLVTGAEFPVTNEANVLAQSPRILLGPSATAKRLCGDVRWDELGHDGIVIRTAGQDLILAGGEPRGTLYAVYTFLEDTVGVRWWTGKDRFIPQKPTLEIGELNTVYVPPFRYREAYYEDVINDHFLQATRLKLNGHMTRTPADWGGHYTIIGWCHTSFDLLPPDKYFASHPEWYSLLDGQRSTRGQLCMSNPAMQAELLKNALQLVQKDPDAGMISITQNDCYNPCQCEQCQQIVREEGSESGPLLRCVNAVAEGIHKDYPDFLVETLAYQYTRHPPKLVRPADNVIIRLCSIECDFARPLSSETNKDFADDMNGWAKIAPNLFVWNYVTDFANYFQPHPNLTPLAHDLQWFADHHVIGVFEQGDAFNAAGDFLQLRAWTLAHLLWNPKLDEAAVRDEFLKGYYGAAAPALANYLDLVNTVCRETKGFSLGCGNRDMSFLTPDTLSKSNQLFAEAAKAVAGDAVLSQRVRRERLPLDLMAIDRYDFDGKIKLARAAGESRQVASAEYDAMVDAFAAQARADGAVRWNEGSLFAAGIDALHARWAEMAPPELPAVGATLPDGQFDIQQDQFKLARKGEWSELVDDPKASDGKAARMPGGHSQWAVQYPLTATDKGPTGAGPWRCYIVARVDTTHKGGSAFQFGVWDSDHLVAKSEPSLERFTDGNYHASMIRLNDFKPGMYVWVAPLGNADAVQNVYVDRLFITRDRE